MISQHQKRNVDIEKTEGDMEAILKGTAVTERRREEQTWRGGHPVLGMRVHYAQVVIETKQQNLTDYDPRLAEFLEPSDCFYVHDLTKDLYRVTREAGILDGTLTAQILHTSATLLVNELDEPMLLGDLMRKVRNFAPKNEAYLHNSPMRTVNLCASDTHCDRNGDAHVKSSLFGHSSITLIIRDGNLVLGQWQKIALLEFDGPRPREVLVQVMGLG